MVERVLAQFDISGIEGRVLIIDDASPDGTGDIVEAMAAEEVRLEVLHRDRKEGIGPAYLAGFAIALSSGADLIMEMDCDFSHDPTDIPRLIRGADSADVVLGSRYVPGGRVENWGLVRRWISRAGCLYARKSLRVSTQDLTGGFKCFRSDPLRAIAMSPPAISSAGYVFQVEMTYRAICAGFRVVEIPITFVDRLRGKSKMSHRIVLEAVWRIPLLRMRIDG